MSWCDAVVWVGLTGGWLGVSALVQAALWRRWTRRSTAEIQALTEAALAAMHQRWTAR
jgi:hypothetical protein